MMRLSGPIIDISLKYVEMVKARRSGSKGEKSQNLIGIGMRTYMPQGTFICAAVLCSFCIDGNGWKGSR